MAVRQQRISFIGMKRAGTADTAGPCSCKGLAQRVTLAAGCQRGPADIGDEAGTGSGVAGRTSACRIPAIRKALFQRAGSRRNPFAWRCSLGKPRRSSDPQATSARVDCRYLDSAPSETKSSPITRRAMVGVSGDQEYAAGGRSTAKSECLARSCRRRFRARSAGSPTHLQCFPARAPHDRSSLRPARLR